MGDFVKRYFHCTVVYGSLPLGNQIDSSLTCLACRFGTKPGRKCPKVPLNNSPIIHSFFALGVFLAIVIGVAIALVVMVRPFFFNFYNYVSEN